MEFLAEKIHVHRWPQDSPKWDESTQLQIDGSFPGIFFSVEK